MREFKSRVLTLALAGLMAGQAILPVSATENTDPAQSMENAEAGIMLIDEVGADADATGATTAEDAAAATDSAADTVTVVEAETPDAGAAEGETAASDTSNAETETTERDNNADNILLDEVADDTEELATLENVEEADAVVEDTEESDVLSGGIKGLLEV